MRQASALQATTSIDGYGAGLSTVASASERAERLVRQAMTFLPSDPQAARRCLNDAASLLSSESQAAANALVAENAFRPGGLTRWQTKRTLGYIEANLGSKIGIRELADVVAFSKSHFSRAFRRSLGLSPMAYVAIRRVERAKLMMTSTREQLTEIALACGFVDQSHLSRSFRRIVGLSPGLWRRKHADMVDWHSQGRVARESRLDQNGTLCLAPPDGSPISASQTRPSCRPG